MLLPHESRCPWCEAESPGGCQLDDDFDACPWEESPFGPYDEETLDAP